MQLSETIHVGRIVAVKHVEVLFCLGNRFYLQLERIHSKTRDIPRGTSSPSHKTDSEETTDYRERINVTMLCSLHYLVMALPVSEKAHVSGKSTQYLWNRVTSIRVYGIFRRTVAFLPWSLGGIYPRIGHMGCSLVTVHSRRIFRNICLWSKDCLIKISKKKHTMDWTKQGLSFEQAERSTCSWHYHLQRQVLKLAVLELLLD